jgi:DNA-directed RNA polymerase subunit RPC12/RpoP
MMPKNAQENLPGSSRMDFSQDAPPIEPGPHAPVGFRCPYCNATTPPFRGQRISTGGWITFAVLMFVCLPLFWIGLLMKEDYTQCSNCGIKLGG